VLVIGHNVPRAGLLFAQTLDQQEDRVILDLHGEAARASGVRRNRGAFSKVDVPAV
jgi:hypothetical protein